MGDPVLLTWRRLEPECRSETGEEALVARIADPLWMLFRQWQLGEFHGEDAGSPSRAEVTIAEYVPQDLIIGDERIPFDRELPIEFQCFCDEPPQDLLFRLELGRELRDLLRARGLHAVVEALGVAQATLAEPKDPDARMLLAAVVEPPALDGLASLQLLGMLRNESANVGAIALSAQDRDAVSALVRDFVGPVRSAGSWDRRALRHRASLTAIVEDQNVTFSLEPDGRGRIDWYSADLVAQGPAMQPARATPTVLRVRPGPVLLPGMPSVRYWDFEDRTTNVLAATVDPKELTKLALVDFLLVAGNDWFFAPVELTPGTITEVRSIVVENVFGERFAIDTAAIPSTKFVHASLHGTLSRPWLFLPPQSPLVRRALQERVAYRRDEMANMAWAIEEAIADDLGRASACAVKSRRGAPRPPSSTGLREYVLLTEVAAHWHPLMPRAISTSASAMILPTELVAGFKLDGAPPRGQLLGLDAPGRHAIEENVLPRSGVTVARGFARARTVRGATVNWMMRWVERAGGEVASGLRADVLVRQGQEESDD